MTRLARSCPMTYSSRDATMSRGVLSKSASTRRASSGRRGGTASCATPCASCIRFCSSAPALNPGQSFRQTKCCGLVYLNHLSLVALNLERLPADDTRCLHFLLPPHPPLSTCGVPLPPSLSFQEKPLAIACEHPSGFPDVGAQNLNCRSSLPKSNAIPSFAIPRHSPAHQSSLREQPRGSSCKEEHTPQSLSRYAPKPTPGMRRRHGLS